MFQSGYQGGPYFEIFSTQGRDSTARWKLSSSGIKKVYEKDVKGYVLTLEGTPATTKMHAPKDQKQPLTLVQRYLIIQCYIPLGSDFSMDIGVTDLGNNKRRLLLSSALKETQVTPLHAKIPLGIVRRAVWMNLALDMVSLVGDTWTSQTYRSIEQLSISANCKVRRIFTMKSQPPDSTDDEEMYGCPSTNNGEVDAIPRQCQMAPDVQQVTQVITLNKIKCAERIKAGGKGQGQGLADQVRLGSMLDLDLNSSGRKLQSSDGKIAFGSKAPKAPPPETGRKTARQGSLTTRSSRSQTSRADNASLNNSNGAMNGSTSFVSHLTESLSGSRDSLIAVGSHTGQGHNSIEFVPSPPARQPAPGSAGSVQSTQSKGSCLYSRQQSEPVTQDDYSSVGLNGIKDSPIVAPHPPRQPSNDRVRRRPRVKTLGQRGDSNYSSPPTSASLHLQPPLDPSSSSQGQGVTGQSQWQMMKDSGVGPDVPEIQSPRKVHLDDHQEEGVDEFTEYDSVSDVISLLRGQQGVEEKIAGRNTNNSWRRTTTAGSERSERRIEEERLEEMVREDDDDFMEDMRMGRKRCQEENVDEEEEERVSSSASESSHPGEYEDSDEEASPETDKLHFFISPPKSAPRRNISPATAEAETNQNKKSHVKGFRSNVSRRTSESSSSHRGARLEDDFVSHSSSEDDAGGEFLHHHHHHNHHHPHHHQSRYRRPMGSAATAISLRNTNINNSQVNSSNSGNTSSYLSSNYSFPPSSSHPVKSARAVHATATTTITRVGGDEKSQGHSFTPKTSGSPDPQRPPFNPDLYSDSGRSSLSRMSRKSLREITNPHQEIEGSKTLPQPEGGNAKLYNHLKYQGEDLTESFERQMFASMRRQGEEVLEDISPPPHAPTFNRKQAAGGVAGHSSSHSQTLRSSSHFLNPSDPKPTHLHSESPATTSDDDTSFSTWKAPVLNQVAHNYQDEMKSRRSSDTLTSSNPRDWSGVLSPPIDPLSQVNDLQGTMEGISDELSDEAPTTANAKPRKTLTVASEEEKLDLFFDPKLNCYYDPRTKKWYELLT